MLGTIRAERRSLSDVSVDNQNCLLKVPKSHSCVPNTGSFIMLDFYITCFSEMLVLFSAGQYCFKHPPSCTNLIVHT